ncbi:hypothetical protein [Burkholderia cepacia]|uniref:hypothetical protein n=1 Tax=Burkholderia cepacia TaxID=292 RepID=UPI000AF7C76F|nr:hypothetical protein [Burkholderia cepacia]
MRVEVVFGHLCVALGMLLLLSQLRRWRWVFALAVWPGTVAHEALHFGVGALFGARPISFSVWPRKMSDGSLLLGFVQFARLRWWNKLPVALAPLGLLPCSAYLVWMALAVPLLSVGGCALKLLAAQLVLGAFPSGQDWRHAIIGAVSAGCLLLLVVWFAARC